jgi:two-component system sensor histidine kinase/response regulator
MTVASNLAGSYDYRLVALSILIACCASYTALRLGPRTTSSRGAARLAWLTCGAISMGFGIWSMHYVGMLAFTLPITILYDLPTVIVSLLAAIFASAIALFVVSRQVVSTPNLIWGSIFMGSGILAMHYIGMAAMRARATCSYDPVLLAASAVIAVGGSLLALWLGCRFRADLPNVNIWRLLSAVIMGTAIAAMHYTGMAAATFSPTSGPVDYSYAVSVSALGVTGIVIVTFLLLGFTVFSSNIDQRLAAHRALAEELHLSKQMLQSVLDNVPQRVFWQDRDGRYLGCNQAFSNDARLTSPEEAIGKTAAELPSAEIPASCSDLLSKAIAEGSPILNSEFQTNGADGQRRWLRASSIPLRDSHERTFGVLGTYEDVTERRRSEEAIKRSNAALSEFAHVVSHDLRSPLRVSKNYAQLVAKKYGEQLEERGRRFLAFIEESMTHMDELTSSLLEFATATEPDPGGQTQVPLDAALQRAIANLQSLLKEANAQITHDPLPVLTGYPAHFLQIFQNLISNAIKYRKPEIAPQVHVGAIKKPDYWIICVQDNGIGISAEDQQRIFAPLTRLHGREIPGFGIGLATCRKVVEQQGGNMWVDSQLGVGSAFYFSWSISRNGDAARTDGRSYLVRQSGAPLP